MKKLLKVLTTVSLISSLLLSGCTTSNNTDNNEPTSEEQSTQASEIEAVKTDKVLQIGIIQLVEHPALDASCSGFRDALEQNGYANGTNIKIDFQNAQNDMSNLKTISQKFVGDKKDLILAIGTGASQSIAAETSDIPIVITAVTDPAGVSLVESNEKPNTNITGTSDLTPVKEQIDLIKQLVPDAKKIAVLYSSGEQNSLIQANMAEEAAKALGIETEHKTVSSTNDVPQVVESIVGNADAIYIPTDNTLASSMPSVAGIAIQNKIPVIVGEQGMVEQGGLASWAINYYELGYKTGMMAIDILSGKSKPQDMPIQYSDSIELVINKRFADEINITIPDTLIKEAQIIE